MICVFLIHYQSPMGLKSKVWGKQANKWIINAKQFPICRYLQNCQLLHKEAAHTSGAANPLALCWKCNSPWTGCAWRIKKPIYMWHEQPIIEWLQRMISIVACCHSVKLYALAAKAFRSQQLQTAKNLVVHWMNIHIAAFIKITKINILWLFKST